MKAAKASGSREKQKKVKDNQKQANKQKKGKKNKGQMDDEAGAGDAPRKWNDYTVQFEFPEPTELNPPLIQLMDADFKYVRFRTLSPLPPSPFFSPFGGRR